MNRLIELISKSSHIPESDKQTAISEINEFNVNARYAEKAGYNPTPIDQSIRYILSCSFVWEQTELGWRFWNGIQRHLLQDSNETTNK
jgi:hypothetical protein